MAVSAVAGLRSRRPIAAAEELGRFETDGYANNEIARHLTVSKEAVEGHVTSIFRKLRVPDAKRFDRRVTAILAYLQAGSELASKDGFPRTAVRDNQPSGMPSV